MNRFWGHTLSSALVAAAAASAFPACVHNDGSLFVHGVLYPPTPSGTTCTYTADPTSAELSRGTVDAALMEGLYGGGAYTPEFLLASSILSQANSVTPQNETSTLTLQGVDVLVVDPVTNATIMNNSVLAAGIVEAASGSSPSYTAISAAVMDAAAIAHFNPGYTTVGGVTTANQPKLAEVYVKFYGKTLGEEYVESDQFLFPVDVCYGCLVSFPATANLAAYCSGVGTSLATSQPCVAGQDQPLDCRQCYPLAVCAP